MPSSHPFIKIARENEDILEDIMTEIYREFLSYEAGPFSIVDGGAHMGSHTFEFTKLKGCSRVYAIEANRDLAASLLSRGPMRDGTKVQVIAAAVQDDPAVKELSFMLSTSHPGRSGLNSIFKEDPEVSFAQTVVPASTIDLVVRDRADPVRFIKLDLEGGEYNAIRGSADVMLIDRPIFCMENSVYSPEYNGYSSGEYFEMFRSRKYTPITFLGEVMTEDNMFDLWYAWTAPDEKVDMLCDLLRRAIARRV